MLRDFGSLAGMAEGVTHVQPPEVAPAISQACCYLRDGNVHVRPSAVSCWNGMFKSKFAAGMILLAACGAASAKWIKVAETEGDTFYYESGMVRKTGKYLRLWHLVDHSAVKMAARGPFKSSKVQIELHCRENSWRVIYLTYHSERMGGGNLLDAFFDPNAEWEPIVPNSPIQKISEGACKEP